MSTNQSASFDDHSTDKPVEKPTDQTAAELKQIQDALRGLRFGSVNIVVQDGVVVQIDRTEKRRLRRENTTRRTAS